MLRSSLFLLYEQGVDGASVPPAAHTGVGDLSNRLSSYAAGGSSLKTPTGFIILSILVLMVGCDFVQSTPQVFVVTATPEPVRRETSSPVPTSSVPTWTPEPTWTPQPSPTPTMTPEPTSTPTLQEAAFVNAEQCIASEERSNIDNEMPGEVIASEDGSAFVKAGFYGNAVSYNSSGNGRPASMPLRYRYWKYEPGPVAGSFACKDISFDEYPLPTVTSATGEARILEVTQLADESCRNWINVWQQGDTFLDTQSMTVKLSDGGPQYSHRFGISEIRPATEQFAFVLVDHHQRVNPVHLDSSNWHTLPMYMIYEFAGNTCRETEYSSEAWDAWPEIISELMQQTQSLNQTTVARVVADTAKLSVLLDNVYRIIGPTTVAVDARHQYSLSGPVNTDIYLRWYDGDGSGVGGGLYSLGEDGSAIAEWTFTSPGGFTVSIHGSGAHREPALYSLSGTVTLSP